MRYIHIKPNKTDEAPPEAEVGLLSTFGSMVKKSWWQWLLLQPKKEIALEVGSINQQTLFQMAVPDDLSAYFMSQLLSHRPQLLLTDDDRDVFGEIDNTQGIAVANLNLMFGATLPIKTSTKTEDTPLFGSILGYLAKLPQGDTAQISMVLRTTNQRHWINRIRQQMTSTDSEGKVTTNPQKTLMDQKISSELFEVQLRLKYVSGEKTIALNKLKELAGVFGAYTQADGNGLVMKKQKGNNFLSKMQKRTFGLTQPTMILNSLEIASLWHIPGQSLAQIGGISWGRTIVSDTPENLPVAEGLNETEKREINFFAKTGWRNHEAVMGIKREDRSKHMYIIGKTGAGKSTLIANMAINDIRNGEGVAIIDPHGDLSEMILDYVPKRRLADVVYLDPTLSADRAFSLNLFDPDDLTHTDVVASGIVSVFHKLYGHSWGPRLEYILRNTIISLLYAKEATFADIPKMLTDNNYRRKVIELIRPIDPVIGDFWVNEFEKMNDKLRTDAIAPVLNKVGQFLSAQRIRQVVGVRKSTFSIDRIMEEGKILILNLSQGRLGEDTTALLGAMFITKIQLAAMRRVHMSQEKRKDFYLYVDEFQNFATESFTKILSEARKYKLNLILANQYMGQVSEPIQKAIFGNIGTLATFVVGAGDAGVLERELGGIYKSDDLVNLGRYEILLKMAIDGLTSAPFAATTLPLPSVINGNRQKITNLSLERYYHKINTK